MTCNVYDYDLTNKSIHVNSGGGDRSQNPRKTVCTTTVCSLYDYGEPWQLVVGNDIYIYIYVTRDRRIGAIDRSRSASDRSVICATIDRSRKDRPIQITHFINSSLHSPQHRSTTIWDDARMTDSCQLKLVICVIKTSLHKHCIKTVIKFLLVCIVYPELSGVLLRYVSFTNKEEWMNEW